MDAPRVAPVRVVVEERFGVRLVDPYRWMEDEGAEFRDWIADQGVYARDVLAGLPERDALIERIEELADRTPQYGDLAAAGGRAFMLRRDPGADVAALVVRDGSDGERVLLDPGGEGDDLEHASIDWYAPSPDGRLVACAVARGGSEQARLRVLDVDTGSLLPDAVDGVLLPHVSWLPGEPAFLYHRFPDLRDHRDSAAYRHRVGTDQADDELVLGRDADVPMTAVDRPLVHAAGDHLIAVISHGALHSTTSGLSNCTFHVRAPDGRWTRLAGPDDDVVAFTVAGDRLLLVRYGEAPRGEVLSVRLADPDLARAAVLVPAGERVIESVTAVDDVLLVREHADGVARLRRVPLAGGRPRDVPLPVDGTLLAVVPGQDRTALLMTTSWTEPPRIHRYHLDSGTLENTGWLPSTPGALDLVATETLVTARDGETVPLSIVHRRGLTLDGQNPTLLTAYGSYGYVLRPRYRPALAAWFERGGVYAVAHVRGGGERGREWDEAGRLLRRETTISDFVDCAEHLVTAGWTGPDRLAAEGGSAGAVPVGGALVRRPELFAAVVLHVPMANSSRFELTTNGPINVPENGSLQTEDGLRALLISDCSLRVAEGVRYPPVLITAGLNDPRVAPWQPAKLAARLQAASERPVLLRIEEHGGHGIGATRTQEHQVLADELAFLLAAVSTPAPPRR